jgi:hypothetical protein
MAQLAGRLAKAREGPPQRLIAAEREFPVVVVRHRQRSS